MNEKEKRVKYIRLLERFARVAILALKRDDFSVEIFVNLVEKTTKPLHECEAVFLDSAYTKELENFVNLVLVAKFDSENNQDRAELLKRANLLEKLKNAKFKKEKHKSKKFDEF